MGKCRIEPVPSTLRAALEERYPAYALVAPGDHSFVCDADACEARCCRSLTVPADDADASALARHMRMEMHSFLESEGRVPIALPLVQPYVVARREGACLFLRGDQRCDAYPARPKACRTYPYELLLVESPGWHERAVSVTGAREALQRRAESVEGGVRPALMRHRECPGFTGPPLTAGRWAEIVLEIAALRGWA